MPSSFTQDMRIAQLVTPLGKDVLVLRRLDAVEGMNEPFDIRIEAVSDEPVESFSSCLGQSCTVSFRAIGDNERHFNGILAYVQELGVRSGTYVYRLVLRPWLHFFSIRKQSRIFHNQSVPDILKQVFQGGNLSFKLHKDYPPIEYIVQYRESDLAFASRLMEQYGILYYFKHEADKHTLCLIDELSSADTVDGETRDYLSTSRQYRRDEEHFYHWIPERRLTAGKVLVNSYDFKRPSTNLMAEKRENNDFSDMPLMVEDWPHHYVDKSLGERFAQVRLDVERGADSHFLAAGDCISLFPGALVTMKKYPVEEYNKEYLTLRCTHTFLAQEYRSGEAASGDDAYHGNYELIRSDRNYAPPIVTEKPFMHGPQTAKVVGKGEIDVDEHGRIEVLFHWDRANAKSRRVRLAQVWAGKGWGGIYIPRIGMEVIVDFIDGDPDKPIVIGSVYNAENMPPYPLPAQKNLAGWKSNSTVGGGGYNEIVFDDTANEELIRIHGQYDMDTTIEHDMRTTVKNNETREVGANRLTDVGMSEKAPASDYLSVGKDWSVNVGNKIEFNCGASHIVMEQDGTITITAKTILVKSDTITTQTKNSTYNATMQMKILGGMVRINDPLGAPGGLAGIAAAVAKALSGLANTPIPPGIKAIAEALQNARDNHPLTKLLRAAEQKKAEAAKGVVDAARKIVGNVERGIADSPIGKVVGGIVGGGASGSGGAASSGSGAAGPSGSAGGFGGGISNLSGGSASPQPGAGSGGGGGAAGQAGSASGGGGGAAGRAGSGSAASGGGGGAAGQAGSASGGGGGAAGQAGSASGGGGGAAGGYGGAADEGGSGGSFGGGGGAAGQAGSASGGGGGAAGQAGSASGGGGGAAGGSGGGAADEGGSGGSFGGGGGAAGQAGSASGGGGGAAGGYGGGAADEGGSGGGATGGGGAAGQVGGASGGGGGAAGQAGSGGAAGKAAPSDPFGKSGK